VFLPSVPEGFEVRSTVLGIDGPGDYLSDEFLRCIRAKLDLVVRSVEENLGDIIVWCDVNIRFFDLSPSALAAELESSASDVLFQRESPRMDDVNTGFFVCRCTPAALDFFTTVRSELESHPNENEQIVVNRLLFKEKWEMWNGKCESVGSARIACSIKNSKFGIRNGETHRGHECGKWEIRNRETRERKAEFTDFLGLPSPPFLRPHARMATATSSGDLPRELHKRPGRGRAKARAVP
jgi:hypothetical protein